MSYIYDVEMEEGAVKARVYLFDVDSEQHAISQAERLLHQHGIPFTDIRGGMHVGQNRWILVMTYKPTENVTESKYYRGHSAEDVRRRFIKIGNEHNRSENVRVLEASLMKDTAYAQLYIVNADSEQDAENEVRAWLNKYGIPYTQIINIESFHNNAWEASVTYNPS